MIVQGVRVELIKLLRCTSCNSPLSHESAQDLNDATLLCPACGFDVPTIAGVPRFVGTLANSAARRTQASFGYEWTHFNNWRFSGHTNFSDYFQDVDLVGLKGAIVLDAGCGMGRHSREIAQFARQVVAVDFSDAIDQAAHNTAGLGNVDCLQADLLNLPFADDSFDFVYSIGVLHHLEDTERALAGLVRKVKRGGRLRIYLYWKRSGWQGLLLSVVTVIRRLTTRLPFGFLRALCWLLSMGLFVGVVIPYRFLSRCGARFHRDWPLVVYEKYPFNVLYNDQFDRFSAPIEKRYSPEEVRQLLQLAGLRNVRVIQCFGWIGEGFRGD